MASKSNVRAAAALASGTVIVLALYSKAAVAGRLQEKVLANGRSDFVAHCVSCHAADATGTAPRDSKADWPPRDLTMLAKWNAGVFPFWSVYRIVSGEKLLYGHDSPSLPDFSGRMAAYQPRAGEEAAHVRVLALTHYLQSIQK